MGNVGVRVWVIVRVSVSFRIRVRFKFSVTVMDTFRIVWKWRRHRVLLCVGLRKGSPREFRCTQRLPLGALFDGRKWQRTCCLLGLG